MRYFLNQLRNLIKIGKKWGPQLPQSWNRQDLQLWIKTIQWVVETGVPINNILFTTPTVTLWSDAFKYGIGGYNDKGTAWRWYIPPEWNGVLKLNLLEFLASALSIYMTIQQLGHVSHVPAFTDRSSSLGWMYKASSDPLNEGGYDTARDGWAGHSSLTSHNYIPNTSREPRTSLRTDIIQDSLYNKSYV